MLLLGRKKGQRVKIGDDCFVTVVEFCNDGGYVRLGFEAPPSLRIMREELLNQEGDKNATLEADRGTAGAQ